MRASVTARRTFSSSFSNVNSGECTPITTSPWLLYLFAHSLTYGSVLIQLMHVYVQKSTSTTFPRSFSVVRGAEFSQAVAPSMDGMSGSPTGADKADGLS